MSRWFPTSGRGRALLLVVLVLLVSGAVWWRLTGNSGEPSYGGRPLSYWLEEGREAITNGSKTLPIRLNAESEAAVRAIGTNALPKLREWMTAPKPGWRTRAYAWVNQRRFPAVVNRVASVVSGYHRWDPLSSILAFQVLGRDAEGAFPFLIEMLEQDENYQMAVVSLCAIRPKGIHALIETFPKIYDEIRRANIVHTLERAATPNIEHTCAVFAARWVAGDPHVAVRMSAAQLLGTFTNSAAVAVPALTDALTDSDGGVRLAACNSLGRFGKDAASAAVSLRSAMNDSNPQVRADAARALQAIGAPPVE